MTLGQPQLRVFQRRPAEPDPHGLILRTSSGMPTSEEAFNRFRKLWARRTTILTRRMCNPAPDKHNDRGARPPQFLAAEHLDPLRRDCQVSWKVVRQRTNRPRAFGPRTAFGGTRRLGGQILARHPNA